MKNQKTMEVILLAILFTSLAFAGIAIKILVKKNGEFAGTCASQSPFLNEEGEACGFCGASPEEKCKKEEVQITSLPEFEKKKL